MLILLQYVGISTFMRDISVRYTGKQQALGDIADSSLVAEIKLQHVDDRRTDVPTPIPVVRIPARCCAN